MWFRHQLLRLGRFEGFVRPWFYLFNPKNNILGFWTSKLKGLVSLLQEELKKMDLEFQVKFFSSPRRSCTNILKILIYPARGCIIHNTFCFREILKKMDLFAQTYGESVLEHCSSKYNSSIHTFSINKREIWTFYNMIQLRRL